MFSQEQSFLFCATYIMDYHQHLRGFDKSDANLDLCNVCFWYVDFWTYVSLWDMMNILCIWNRTPLITAQLLRTYTFATTEQLEKQGNPEEVGMIERFAAPTISSLVKRANAHSMEPGVYVSSDPTPYILECLWEFRIWQMHAFVEAFRNLHAIS